MFGGTVTNERKTPYHEGELRAQQLSGVVNWTQDLESLPDYLDEGIQGFVAQQTLAACGSVDREGRVWASALVGEPGFLTASERVLELHIDRMVHAPSDPLWANLEHSPGVGMVVIHLASRQRVRVNGVLAGRRGDVVQIDVRRAYPECPKYITPRQVLPPTTDEKRPVAPARRGAELGAPQRELIARVETCFVASNHAQQGLDASHRGGPPGFITVLDDRTLLVPDYFGNGIFSTLGNFLLDPAGALVLLDFEGGRTLQLAGRAAIDWRDDDPQDRTKGTKRSWKLAIDEWVELDIPTLGRAIRRR
jgi:predicted pyridoxine 5'-phosphate oxidase superfamily flavin-nucleotide-binding protein